MLYRKKLIKLWQTDNKPSMLPVYVLLLLFVFVFVFFHSSANAGNLDIGGSSRSMTASITFILKKRGGVKKYFKAIKISQFLFQIIM